MTNGGTFDISGGTITATTITSSGNVNISGGTVSGSLTVNVGNVNISADAVAGLDIQVNGGEVRFENLGAWYTVKSLNTDDNATGDARIIIPGGGEVFADVVQVVPSPGNAITRQMIEAVQDDIDWGQWDGTKGILLEHDGHDSTLNRVGLFAWEDTLYLYETIEGDTNGDGICDGADISTALSYQDQDPADFGFGRFTHMEGDWNNDLHVDGADIGMMLSRQDQAYVPDGASFSPSAVAVPEPASLLPLLGLGATLRRQRR